MKPTAVEFTGVRPLMDADERTRFTDELAGKIELLDASSEFWFSFLEKEERLMVVTSGGSFTCVLPFPDVNAMKVRILESDFEDLAQGEEVNIDGATLGGPIVLQGIKRFCSVQYSKMTEIELTDEDLKFIENMGLTETLEEFRRSGKVISRGGKEYQRMWDGINRYTPEVTEAYRFFDGQEASRIF